MANSLQWNDLSLTQLDKFYTCSSLSDSYSFLGLAILKQPAPYTSKQTILLDMYYNTLAFAKSLVLTPEQTSVLFSVIKSTHENAVSSPFITFDADFDYFKKLLLAHSINRPPYSVRVFSLGDVGAISDWATQGMWN
jgi:hypothetical protein